MGEFTLRKGAVIAAVVATFATFGCGGGAGEEVRAFAEVQASEFAFALDSSDPSRAIFRVTTTEPMICAIIWGEDDRFGRFNSSLAMNGTGIVQHDVVLPDVDSTRTYSFVVSGVTASGHMYRSEKGEFSLRGSSPTTPRDEPAGVNVARGARVSGFSSEFSAAFAASNAVDGDSKTEWATAGDGDRGFIEIDLGRVRRVTAVAYLTRSMADGSSVTTTFALTVDGQLVGTFAAGTVANPRPAAVEFSGKVLRFDVEESTGGNVGAVEIGIYSTAA
jgi:hypothetical protein